MMIVSMWTHHNRLFSFSTGPLSYGWLLRQADVPCCCCHSSSASPIADSGSSFPSSPPPSCTSPSAQSLCFCRPRVRQGGRHCDQHIVITAYCLSLLVAVPLVFRPPTPLLPPPPLPLLELLIVASHPLPLISFLIVVSHLVVVVVIFPLSLHHPLIVNVLLFVMGSNGPSWVPSTYSHPAAATPPLVVDCCVASW